MSPREVVAVSELAPGARVCGWCDEFEGAAKKAAELALENDRLRRELAKHENGSVALGLGDYIRELRRQLDEEQLRASRAESAALRAEGTCPICGWQPKRFKHLVFYRDKERLRWSLRAHVGRVHARSR